VAARRDFTSESLAAGVRAGDRRALARSAAEARFQAAEPAQSPVEPEPAIEAHGGARQRAV